MIRRYTQTYPGRWGNMMVLLCDTYQTHSIAAYGEWAPHEVKICLDMIKPGDHVLDIGANIGSFTVPMARKVGREGFVLAIEPQRLPFYVLAANIVGNYVAEWTHALNFAAGDHDNFVICPNIDPNKQTNVGGVRMNDKDNVAGVKTNDPPSKVKCVKVDSLNLERLDFVKIDVEGWETHVLRGAAETIAKCKPAIFAEALPFEKENRECMAEFFKEHGYKSWEIISPLFDPDNIRGEAENAFGGQSDFNVLAVHESQPDPDIAKEVKEFKP